MQIGATARRVAAPVAHFSPHCLWLRSEAAFSPGADETVREFLLRAFVLEGVESVTLRRGEAKVEVRVRASEIASSVGSRLAALLRGANTPDHATRERVARMGGILTAWRVSQTAADRLRLRHPALWRRRDMLYRLRAELVALHGVKSFSANPLTTTVSVRFDPGLIDGERLVSALEKSWPRLLAGLEPPPSPKRLFAAGGLLTLAATAQYFRPALRPFAVLGVVLYGLPNVIAAARRLSHGEVGLPLLYSTGMAFSCGAACPSRRPSWRSSCRAGRACRKGPRVASIASCSEIHGVDSSGRGCGRATASRPGSILTASQRATSSISTPANMSRSTAWSRKVLPAWTKIC